MDELRRTLSSYEETITQCEESISDHNRKIKVLSREELEATLLKVRALSPPLDKVRESMYRLAKDEKERGAALELVFAVDVHKVNTLANITVALYGSDGCPPLGPPSPSPSPTAFPFPGTSAQALRHKVSGPGQEEPQAFQIPLPEIEIEIPQFHGEYEEWIDFRESFACIIQNNKSLKPVDKYLYLRANVFGAPFDLIKNCTGSDEMYAQAWDILKQRYDSPWDIVNAHLSLIMNHPKVEFPNPLELQSLLNTFNNSLWSLKAANVPIDNWDPFIVFIVTSKLDSETIMEWAMSQKGNQLSTWDQLKNFLQQHIRILEDYGPKRSTQAQATAHVVTSMCSSHRPSLVPPSQKKGQQGSSRSSCSACHKSGHPLFACSKFKSMNSTQRFQAVKKSQLCFNCLHQHPISQCQSSARCKKCAQRHNTLLHAD